MISIADLILTMPAFCLALSQCVADSAPPSSPQKIRRFAKKAKKIDIPSRTIRQRMRSVVGAIQLSHREPILNSDKTCPLHFPSRKGIFVAFEVGTCQELRLSVERRNSYRWKTYFCLVSSELVRFQRTKGGLRVQRQPGRAPFTALTYL